MQVRSAHVPTAEDDRPATDSAFLERVGGDTILELWVPADELAEFNAHIVGLIEVVHEFPAFAMKPI